MSAHHHHHHLTPTDHHHPFLLYVFSSFIFWFFFLKIGEASTKDVHHMVRRLPRTPPLFFSKKISEKKGAHQGRLHRWWGVLGGRPFFLNFFFFKKEERTRGWCVGYGGGAMEKMVVVEVLWRRRWWWWWWCRGEPMTKNCDFPLSLLTHWTHSPNSILQQWW